jgi:predicted MFS family arabinose efflux permease
MIRLSPVFARLVVLAVPLASFLGAMRGWKW